MTGPENPARPRGVVVAGAGSGSGKTLVTLSLLTGFAGRERDVRPFKCGPDFIDPRYHEWIAGLPSFNLDLHFSPPSRLRETFDRLVGASSGGVVEGVMGLYDGEGRGTSTYDIARILELPAILVINAQGIAETLGALVRGLLEFRKGIRYLGVVATRTGSDRHRNMLAEALRSEDLPPLLGVLPRQESLSLPERHLGLFGPEDLSPGKNRTFRESLASAALEFDWERIESAFRIPGPSPREKGKEGGDGSFFRVIREGVHTLSLQSPDLIPPDGRGPRPGRPIRLGIALDKAFWFYYPENLETLIRHGIRPEFFSPLSDLRLPPALDGLYLGGGYPETHVGTLSENRKLIDEIRHFAGQNHPVYAECGGMLYLTEGLAVEGGKDGIPERETALVGLLPGRFSLRERLMRLGYAEVVPAGPGLFGSAEGPIRGHLFHYTRLVGKGDRGEEGSGDPGGRGSSPPFRHLSGNGGEGVALGPVVASYLHLFFPSNESYVDSWARALRSSR